MGVGGRSQLTPPPTPTVCLQDLYEQLLNGALIATTKATTAGLRIPEIEKMMTPSWPCAKCCLQLLSLVCVR